MTEGIIVAIVAGVPTVLVALIGWVTKISDRQSQAELAAAEARQKRQDALETRVDAQAKDLRALTVAVQKLEDKVRDQSELIDDAVPMIRWIDQGAVPPIPALPWRWLEYLRHHNHKD